MLLGSDTAARKKIIGHKSPLEASRESSVPKFTVTKPSAVYPGQPHVNFKLSFFTLRSRTTLNKYSHISARICKYIIYLRSFNAHSPRTEIQKSHRQCQQTYFGSDLLVNVRVNPRKKCKSQASYQICFQST